MRKKTKKQLEAQAQLREHMTSVILKAHPRLEDDRYRSLIDRFVSQLMEMLTDYYALRNTRESALRFYEEAERKLMASFVTTIPESTGPLSSGARDWLEYHITGALNSANLDLSDASLGVLKEALDFVFSRYSGFTKVGDKEYARKAYLALEDRVLTLRKSQLLASRNAAGQKAMSNAIQHALSIAKLSIEDYQKRKIQDQVLWLFDDYARAKVEERLQVYQLGEERIMFSLFDPTKTSKDQASEYLT